jgi:hypothetical protein
MASRKYITGCPVLMYQSSDNIDQEYLVVCPKSWFRESCLPVGFVLIFTVVLALLLGTAVNNLYREVGCSLLQPFTDNKCQRSDVSDPIVRSLPSFVYASATFVLSVASLRHINSR